MRRLRWVLLLVACLSLPIAGQTAQGELFGGYSLEHIAPGCGSNYRCGGISPGDATNLSGWIASTTFFVYRSFGVSAQFTGGYNGYATLANTSVHRHTYQFGPAYAFHLRNTTVFAHALFGGVSQGSSDQTLSYSRFLWSVGGGLDFKVSSRLSIRPAQVDYERQHVPVNFSPDVSVNGFRYSAGIVLRF